MSLNGDDVLWIVVIVMMTMMMFGMQTHHVLLLIERGSRVLLSVSFSCCRLLLSAVVFLLQLSRANKEVGVKKRRKSYGRQAPAWMVSNSKNIFEEEVNDG